MTCAQPDEMTRIAVTADYQDDNPGHRATDEALGHAAAALGLRLEVQWVPTKATLTEAGRARLALAHGIFSAGGVFESKDGALEAIRFAREGGWPFFAT